MLMIDTKSCHGDFLRLWTSKLIGFTYILRGGELAVLELRDLAVLSFGGLESVGIPMRKSKTDQEELGAFTSLEITHQGLCPVTRMRNLLNRTECQHRGAKVSGDDIIGMVPRLIKRSADGRGLPPDRFPTQPFRNGGATCLYHSGVDLVYICGDVDGGTRALLRFIYISETRSCNDCPRVRFALRV